MNYTYFQYLQSQWSMSIFSLFFQECCYSSQDAHRRELPKLQPPEIRQINRQKSPDRIRSQPTNKQSKIYERYLQKRMAEKNSQLALTLNLIDGSTHRIKVNGSMTILGLKQHIHKTLSEQLPPKLMNLCFKGQKVNDTIILKYLPLKDDQLIITQRKIDLPQVSKIRVNQKRQDPLTMELGTVEMSCGHQIGRDSMTFLIRSLIQRKQYSIKCPNQSQNGPCGRIWDFVLCKKIAVLTKDEIQEFQTGLSMNMINQQTNQCPKCSSAIVKGTLTNSKAVCPSCQTCFCYDCFEEWVGDDEDYCGNIDCKFYSKLLSTCQWNKTFNLADQNNKFKLYKTPQYRACVHCKAIIKHSTGCKHMQCFNCGKSFCWVCLSIPEGQNYQCGDYNHYCGTIANVQEGQFEQL